MGEAQDLLPDTGVQESQSGSMKLDEQNPAENPRVNKTSFLSKRYKWWLQMIVYSIFVLAGQAVGTLLGRLYFNNGGKSQWMATLVPLVGFPILLPLRWLKTPQQNNHPQITTTEQQQQQQRFPRILALIYVALGIFSAMDGMLYSIGLQYLTVTTYTLLCSSQLAFNALFSYILNRQKLTPCILNSLLLLTISSVLLIFEPDSGGPHHPSKRKYAIGFVSTLGASAGYAFMLSATQLAFTRIIKKESMSAIVDMVVYQSLVGSVVIVIGIFASGDWRKLHGEMTSYKLGTASYVMNLVWTAVSWQIYTVGAVGLIFMVSSLFSNVISILGTPLAPVMAAVFLGERMTGLKGVAMVVAMWGLGSYMYQHYIDDLKEKKKKKMEGSGDGGGEEVCEVGLSSAAAAAAAQRG